MADECGGRVAPRRPPFSVFLTGGALSALLYALSFPSFNFSWLGWIALAPLLWCAARPASRPALLGFSAGVAANLATLYWVWPTCRLGGAGPLVAVVALLSLCAYMALYWAAFSFLSAPMLARRGAWSVFGPAAAWTGLEWLRTFAFTGFPWLFLGYSQWPHPPLIANALWGGAYAVSFQLALGSSVAAAFFRRDRRAVAQGGAALAALLCLSAVVHARSGASPSETDAPSIAVVQGNIDQYQKWDSAYERMIVDVYERLTREASAAGAEIIIWPETAVPGWVPNERRFVDWLRDLASETRTVLLVGAASRQDGGDFNAALLFSPTGGPLAQYRKQHLVPFGEYVPLEPVLARWIPVLNALGSFGRSHDKAVFRDGVPPLSVSICFEDLFPRLISEFPAHGAELLVNITNDGWYVDTAAPEQHFIANVFRAVETGRWVVRSANTGISGFIDPSGRVRAKTALLERTFLIARPVPRRGLTPYVRFGDWFALVCAFAGAAAFFASRMRPARGVDNRNQPVLL